MRVNWWKPTGLLACFEVALLLFDKECFCPDLSMSVEVCVFFFCFSLVGVFVFSLLTVLGSSIFALGSHFKGSPYLLPMMLTGRLLFGSGNGSLTSKEFTVLIMLHQRVIFILPPRPLSYQSALPALHQEPTLLTEEHCSLKGCMDLTCAEMFKSLPL